MLTNWKTFFQTRDANFFYGHKKRKVQDYSGKSKNGH
jgi:hypothetical protein